MKAHWPGWGSSINLELLWVQREHGTNSDGPWNLYRAMLWQRQPPLYLASLVIRNKEYVIHTQGLFGMTKEQQEALEAHLKDMGMKKRQDHVGI